MADELNFLTKTAKWYKKWWGIVLLILFFISSCFLVWFIYLYANVLFQLYQGPKTLAQTAEQETPYEMAQIIDIDDPFLGTKQAVLQIVEFGDFMCPVCQRSYSIMRELALQYPDLVQVYWKHYPVTSYESVDFALAAQCAHEQDKFWAFHDKIFLLQEQITTDDLSELAKQLGLNVEIFDNCLQDEQTFNKIKNDFEAGETVEALGTPTFIVNGYKLQGYVPVEVWQDLILKIQEYEKQKAQISEESQLDRK